jgi:prepilin-type N-terminal cleavage/methylation domain-containing protein
MKRRRAGFSLIEVLACVLVLGLGLMAATSLLLYGLHLAREARGRSMGMATALAVLYDSAPIATDAAATPAAAADGSAEGYLNGLWVVRSESDETVLDGANLVAVTVHVDVYEGQDGHCYASVSGRMLRRK